MGDLRVGGVARPHKDGMRIRKEPEKLERGSEANSVYEAERVLHLGSTNYTAYNRQDEVPRYRNINVTFGKRV